MVNCTIPSISTKRTTTYHPKQLNTKKTQEKQIHVLYIKYKTCCLLKLQKCNMGPIMWFDFENVESGTGTLFYRLAVNREQEFMHLSDLNRIMEMIHIDLK